MIEEAESAAGMLTSMGDVGATWSGMAHDNEMEDPVFGVERWIQASDRYTLGYGFLQNHDGEDVRTRRESTIVALFREVHDTFTGGNCGVDRARETLRQ